VHKAGGVGVLVDLGGVAAVARAASLAVDNDLGVEADGTVRLEVVKDVEAIGDGAGGALGPAGAAVLGDVLVFVPGEVVLAVHVSPVDGGGQVLGLVKLPSGNGVAPFAVFKFSDGNAATVHGLRHEGLSLRVEGLGEGVYGLVVEDGVLLSVGGDVLDAFGPGVLGDGPGAV
jgi:hypothetical protein